MKQYRYTYFERTFDIEEMLRTNAEWLSKQVNLPVTEFVEIAEQLSMRQEDWNKFWNMIREIEKRTEEIEIYIEEREQRVSEKKFQALQIALGEPEEVSNCCDAGVEPHNVDDHTSICSYCKEGCGVVYIF
jgi:hypothetical protein